jgi:hypothetical protein
LKEVARAEKELPGIGQQVKAALDEFYREVPDAKTIRDAIAHMDSWVRGEGHRQAQRPWRLMFEQKPSHYALWVSDMRLDIRAAAAAVMKLHWTVVTAWSDYDAQQAARSPAQNP